MISVLFPYKSDNGGRRDQLFSFVLWRWKKLFPEAELCIGVTEDHPFNRSRALNKAAEKATGDILIVADSDTIFDLAQLKEGIRVAREEQRIIFPYKNYCKLDEITSNEILTKDPALNVTEESTKPYEIATGSVSGIVIIPRKVSEAVGGFDDRFEDWGCEDHAFYWAVKTLCGPTKRLEGSIFHLWHPLAPAAVQKTEKFIKNEALLAKYQAAAECPAVMKIVARVNRHSKPAPSAKDPGQAEVSFQKGLEEFRHGRLLEAIENWSVALLLDQTRSDILTNIAFAWMNLEQLERAELALSDALILDVNNLEAWLNFGVSRLERGDVETANRFFDQCLLIDANSEVVWKAKARCFAQLGKIQESELCFGKALEISPQSSELKVDLAILYAHSNRKSEAMSKVLEAMGDTPQDPRAAILKNQLLDLA